MQRVKPYSPAEPVTDLRKIKVCDNSEPLVDYLGLSSRIIVAKPRWLYARVSFLRKSVAERLAAAADSLPSGYKLAVLEGWRPEYIQARMYQSGWRRWKERHPEWSDAQLRRVVNRFTAPLHGRVPPPHSTGAALDVVLADDQGHELDMVSPHKPFEPAGYPSELADLSPEAKNNRTVMFTALECGGLTNYPSEWWHWTYGDQGWAYRTGASTALYGRTEPEGWVGFADDMTDEPLQRA